MNNWTLAAGSLVALLGVAWLAIVVRAGFNRSAHHESECDEVEVEMIIRDEEPAEVVKVWLPYGEAVSLRRYAQKVARATHAGGQHPHFTMH